MWQYIFLRIYKKDFFTSCPRYCNHRKNPILEKPAATSPPNVVYFGYRRFVIPIYLFGNLTYTGQWTGQNVGIHWNSRVVFLTASGLYTVCRIGCSQDINGLYTEHYQIVLWTIIGLYFDYTWVRC